MARYAVINEKGDVVNCIEWDGVSQWTPPAGHIVLLSEEANRFDKYDAEKKEFIVWHQREDYETEVVPLLAQQIQHTPTDEQKATVEDLMRRISSLEEKLATKPVE